MAVRNARGQFVKGNPGGPGRPKGSKTRRPRVLDEAVIAAFAEAGASPYLICLARDRPWKFVRVLVESHALQESRPAPNVRTQPQALRRVEPAEPEDLVVPRVEEQAAPTRARGFTPRPPAPPTYDTAIM